MYVCIYRNINEYGDESVCANQNSHTIQCLRHYGIMWVLCVLDIITMLFCEEYERATDTIPHLPVMLLSALKRVGVYSRDARDGDKTQLCTHLLAQSTLLYIVDIYIDMVTIWTRSKCPQLWRAD